MLLELFPLVVALDIWGDRLQNRRVSFLCDNLGVVPADSQFPTTSSTVEALHFKMFAVEHALYGSACSGRS